MDDDVAFRRHQMITREDAGSGEFRGAIEPLRKIPCRGVAVIDHTRAAAESRKRHPAYEVRRGIQPKMLPNWRAQLEEEIAIRLLLDQGKFQFSAYREKKS